MVQHLIADDPSPLSLRAYSGIGLTHNMDYFGGGVRPALLELSSILAFALVVVDNANNTPLAPLTQQL